MDLTSYLLGKKQSGGSSGGRDWSEIGYSAEPKCIQDGIDYAKTIQQTWDGSSKFTGDYNIIYMPLIDTSNITNVGSMFNGCSSLTTVPLLDTSKSTVFNDMFSSCFSLYEVAQFDTSRGTRFDNMFNSCRNLKEIPQFNTENATKLNSMFYATSSLEKVPELNASKCTEINSVFTYATKLKNFGGFLNLGQAYSTSQSANYSTYGLSLSYATLLTHDSLMNVINKLYDIATKGCNAQQLILGSTNVAKLTAEEIAIATNKGWTVS